MTDVDELLESMQTAMTERPVPAFDDVVRRRRRITRRRLTTGSVTLLVTGVAGAGAYLALPGATSAPGTARLSAAAATGHAASQQPAPALAYGGCSSVQITASSNSAGRPDPVAASQQFARDTGHGYPTTGWHVVYQASNVAQVESGAFDTLVVRGPDGTWQVRSAQRCH